VFYPFYPRVTGLTCLGATTKEDCTQTAAASGHGPGLTHAEVVPSAPPFSSQVSNLHQKVFKILSCLQLTLILPSATIILS